MAENKQTHQVQSENGVVTIQIAPPPDNPQQREQLFEAGSLFYVAALLVFLVKQINNLFSVSPND
ncbi:hypothetical protein E9531_15065 [Lampropedia puyangensis]|uniref:Uncharacterized protein n=1 Tax=Lampropedia puyangensis TaxID=1330072 RepID=A0A4S8ETE3_9BURK|nr:hypothetical protein [Lampropedia puyangensis]THT98117.1 hypothetical protein E9531_15065 [Lampropedia puyangensis]